MVGLIWHKKLRNIDYESIFYKGSTGWHIAAYYDGEPYCSCIGFQVHGHCKHIRLLDEIRRSGTLTGIIEYSLDDVLNGTLPIRYLDSSIDSLNEIFNGKVYSSRSIFSVYAEPNVGKTLYMLQEAFYFMSKGYNVMYIDTEGGVAEKMIAWHEIFIERFGKPKGTLKIKGIREIEPLMEFLGYRVRKRFVSADKAGTKGKFEYNVIESIANPKVAQEIKENKIDVIIIDSVTSPFRTAFQISAQQNHPAKADAMSIFYDALLTLQDEYDVFVLTTHHASLNPANMYDVIPKMRGGNTPAFYSKRIFALDRREKKGQRGYRRFWMVRADGYEDFSVIGFAKINGMGYVPLSDDEKKNVKNLLTTGEKERATRVVA